MTIANAPDLATEDYCAFGVATCFLKADGEVSQVEIVEPIPSAALEAILKGVPTSYRCLYGKTLGDVFTEEVEARKPAGLADGVQLCDDFANRAIAAARTYKRKPEATELVPVGQEHRETNYSLERKRVLNNSRAVSAEDNVKQHAYTHQVL
ncbi:MAG: hypothetical protein AAFY11_15765 [Cyanobacteria bacterium J06641_5]